MENGKSDNREENPSSNMVNNNVDSNNNDTNGSNDETRGGGGGVSRHRMPFTELSQVDADLALARTLQEQERAYMMLRMGAGDGSDYGSWETGSYGIGDEEDDDFDDDFEGEYEGSEVEEDEIEEEEEDEEEEEEEEEELEEEETFGATARYEDGSQNAEIDPSAYSSDEVYAQALQDAEEREMAARLLAMAGISGMVVENENENEDGDEDEEGHGGNSQELMAGPAVGRNYRGASLPSLDFDNLSYEELMALGEVVGTESRGLSADTIASLPSIDYKSQSTAVGICDSCVICRLDYDEGDALTVLSCKHSYHPECINNWLQIKKVCPVCNAEVSNSANS